MKIVLVHPAGSNWIPVKKDITATANRMAPLGLLSIAAYLEKEGHNVKILDCLGPRTVSGVDANVRIILISAGVSNVGPVVAKYTPCLIGICNPSAFSLQSSRSLGV